MIEETTLKNGLKNTTDTHTGHNCVAMSLTVAGSLLKDRAKSIFKTPLTGCTFEEVQKAPAYNQLKSWIYPSTYFKQKTICSPCG